MKRKVIFGLCFLLAASAFTGCESLGSSETNIQFTDGKAEVSGSGAKADGTTVAITKGGTYNISGSAEEVQIIISAGENDAVVLNFTDAQLSNAEDYLIQEEQADTLTICSSGDCVLTEGTEELYTAAQEVQIATAVTEEEIDSTETAEDSETEEEQDEEEEEAKAVIYAKDDLILAAQNSLTVNGYVQNGIVTKDNLTIEEGATITVTASNDGIRGKDSVLINGGTITVDSVGDAISTDGNMEIADGTFVLTTGNGTDTESSDGQAPDMSDTDMGGQAPDMNNTDMGGQVPDMSDTDMGGQAPGMSDTDMGGQAPGMSDTDMGGQAPDMSNTDMGGKNHGGGMDFTIPDDFDSWLASSNLDDESKEWLESLESVYNTMEDGSSIQGIDKSLFDVPDGLTEYLEGDNDIPEDVQTFLEELVDEMSRDFTDFGGKGMGDMQDSDDSNSLSQKGLKAGEDITISGGTFTLNTADDAIHSNTAITVNAGTFTIHAGDDGMHADNYLTINQGTITIDESVEGLEAQNITIEDGTISVTSSDDGLNACGGSNSFGMGGNMGGKTENAPDVATGVTAEETTEDSEEEDTTLELTPDITINGGSLYVNAQGDGLDSNANLTINGGDVYVDGPSNGGNSAVDIGSENGGIAQMNGGTLVALGYSNMAEDFDTSSTQCGFLYGFTSTVESGTEITISDADGTVLETITTIKSCDCLQFSSADLVDGETYTITAGDETGTITLDGTYTSNTTSSMGMGGVGMPGDGTNPMENGDGTTPPEMPDGETNPMENGDGSTPPEMPDGETNSMQDDGSTPPEKPDGDMGGGDMNGGNMNGGMQGGEAPANNGTEA